jgi:hypothetical protein
MQLTLFSVGLLFTASAVSAMSIPRDDAALTEVDALNIDHVDIENVNFDDFESEDLDLGDVPSDLADVAAEDDDESAIDVKFLTMRAVEEEEHHDHEGELEQDQDGEEEQEGEGQVQVKEEPDFEEGQEEEGEEDQHDGEEAPAVVERRWEA